jgi:phosphoribosylformimino-5-aminoimidazole carboxamide ribotide isomerase
MTRFRPCIDLHHGQVKQIVGSTLSDTPGQAPKENFVSQHDAAWYAELYQRDGLTGGHVIMLGQGNQTAARSALAAYPTGLQIGGGIQPNNAAEWIEAGASHIIVTSAIFDSEGRFNAQRLAELVAAVGRERIVLDLSCKAQPSGQWVVAMNRWQTLTDLAVTHSVLDDLAASCAEFLIHAVDVEGMCKGIDQPLVEHLAAWGKLPLTYAGGARSLADLEIVQKLSGGSMDVTIGSALDLFGGSSVTYAECVQFNRRQST